MKRLNDNFLTTLDSKLSLKDKLVLEVGCGDGKKSVELANTCMELQAIDPDSEAIDLAMLDYSAPNLTYSVGSAENLKFANDYFDIVIFSLSLHHVPINKIGKAIQEASRVAKPNGKIVFLEPAFNGSFFDAQTAFGAGDGDERKEKATAYFEILNSKILTNEVEYYDEVTFKFDSEQDFIDNMQPNKNTSNLNSFLEGNKYTLKAQRRINIFSLKPHSRF